MIYYLLSLITALMMGSLAWGWLSLIHLVKDKALAGMMSGGGLISAFGIGVGLQ